MTAFQRLPFHSSTLLMASWPEAEALMTKFDAASAYRNAASFGSPAFGNELTGKILRGHGAPVWSLVGSIHFYCYCGHGQVDADLSPRCWLLSSLFRWFSHLGSPSLGVSQQFAGVYSAVFQSWPPCPPGQAWGPVYLLGSVMLQARLPAEKRKRFTLLSPLLVTSTMRASSPPRLERSPIAWLTYCMLSNVTTIQFV